MATSFLATLPFLFLFSNQVECSYLLNDVASCKFGELPCENGQCINRKAWCDGPQDCHDGSDEMYCKIGNPNDAKKGFLNNCDKSQYFRCDDGMCIPKAGRCDDMPDCENGEDEESCDYDYDSDMNEDSLDISTTLTPITTVSTTTTTTSTTTTAFPPKSSSRGDVSWIPTRIDALRKSVRYIIEERDIRWGWGKATPRIATALYLANDSYFDFDNMDGLMTKKQLEVQLALDLMRHAEKALRMHELSHYIHALVVTCNNPKNFHGVNIVKLLKKSVAQRQAKSLLVNPIAYLALCNAGEFSDSYIRKLKNMAYKRSVEQRWLDIQAYVLLAISCRTMNSFNDSKEWSLLKKDVARNITEWQQPDGSFGSIYSTGLALQALIAADEYGTETAKGRAMTYLLTKQDWQGSFGTDVDNYFVIPALNMKSLASIHTRNCKPNPYGTQSTEGERQDGKKKKQMYVHYSLWIGGDKNEIQTITLGLPRHSNFLDVMEAAIKINPRYKS
ncbi:uncharacterized protein CG3556-like [Stegodyphus dumicola]|uniref:uncharacterized protein CG3556-like n=1 Tax=Stegodyphus dumicola TaxID=202533 RepID=UPI0015AF35D6|nr:uncharacterized protein CG3556-like [Stegodyphus dumicola]